MNQRLYLPPPLSVGAECTLNSEDSHYLARVLRLKAGDELRCFDGEGSEWAARLNRPRSRASGRASASSQASAVTIGELLRSEARPANKLHLAQGWLKGQAMDHTVRGATELGISDFWPIAALRSNVKLGDGRTQSRLRHWQRILRSAAEQSERLHLPTLHAPRQLDEFLAEAPCEQLLFLQPDHEPLPTDLGYASVCVLIGPEGGWAPEECDMARHVNADFHGLGNLVLRAETAPLAVLAAVRHGWGWR